MAGLGEDGLRVYELGGASVVILAVGGRCYAYHRYCPRCDRPVDFGREGAFLVCRGCATAYDAVRAGRAEGREDLHLEPVPLLVEGNRGRLALAGGER